MPTSPRPPTGMTDGAFDAGFGWQRTARGKNMQQLVLLRWIAVAGQLLAIVVVHAGMDIRLPLLPMLLVLAGLCVFNVLGPAYWRRRPRVTDRHLLLALLVDVGALTALLYLAGGIANPFVFLYVLQVVLAAVLLRPRSRWLVVALTTGCVVALAVVPGPVELPADPAAGLADRYVEGLLLCFVLVATLLVVFIGRIGEILRARDARLAALRQRAAEEEHIVRMGLLASGAAHELGTPLSTLAVILGDWQHLPHFTSDPELLQDVAEMQAQVLRCKAIVGGILQSAGEVRGEAPHVTTARALVDGMAAEWQRSRAMPGLRFVNRIDDDMAIVADVGLRQMLFNILDNAHEASPGDVALDARVEADQLVLAVEDGGPGFDPGMLERLGTPYRSSKGAPGRGLGLFLSVNVARTLGGTIAARNRPGGGAAVTVRIPLQALAPYEHEAPSDPP
ncbi:ATP-binding protein [Thermomonas sp.]|uniref:ATP-binding protein n=1 Tax=Thermomonas sp. TaxID=1971895 RepID=UPI0035B223F1